MSHWNYRIMAKKVGKEIEFGIYEVYYDDNDNPTHCSKNTCNLSTYEYESEDPIKSLTWILNSMKNATKKSIIDYDNFPKIYNKYYRKRKIYTINKLIKKNR